MPGESGFLRGSPGRPGPGWVRARAPAGCGGQSRGVGWCQSSGESPVSWGGCGGLSIHSFLRSFVHSFLQLVSAVLPPCAGLRAPASRSSSEALMIPAKHVGFRISKGQRHLGGPLLGDKAVGAEVWEAGASCCLLHNGGPRSSVAAPLAGGEGPERGRFSITPSQVMVHHHPLLKPFLPLECLALTLGCLEATPLLFWSRLLAPHPPLSGMAPSAVLSVSPNTLREPRGRAHIHTGPCSPPVCTFPPCSWAH